MIGKKRTKKQPVVQRSPHIVRQKQSSFQYSSNRVQPERSRQRATESQEVARESVAKAHTFVKRFAKVPYIVGFIAIVAVCVIASLLPKTPQITITSGQDTIVRDTTQYSRTAQELASGPLSKSKITINRSRIASELMQKYPEIQSVSVDTPLFGQSAVVSIALTRPQLLITSGSSTFALDSRGVAVIDVAKDRPAFKTDGISLITDQSNTPITVGKPALTSLQVAFVTELLRQSNAKQYTVESMNMTAGGGELFVKYTDMPYFVKYSLNEDPRKSFGTFFATKEFLDQKKTPVAEYIDVRIPERAYVK